VSRAHHDRRWDALALAARRRDGWACVRCGSRVRLEVDHIRPVARGGAMFDMGNLQTLCRDCHIDKTRVDNGVASAPERAAWRRAVSALLVKGK